jgi:predicted secreted protein
MLGIRRWGIVHSQCSYPGFRARCRELLQPVVDQVEDFLANGYEVRAVIGVDGSPTCGVNLRPEGDWYGEIGYQYGLDSKVGSVRMEKGYGTMMEILRGMLEERGMEIPFCAVNEMADDKTLDSLLAGSR